MIEGELCYLYKGVAFTYKETEEYCEVTTSVINSSIFDVWALGNYELFKMAALGPPFLNFTP